LSVHTTCEAAVPETGVFASKPGVRCRISGLIRDADGSPCIGCYSDCAIWQREKERLWALGAHRRVVAPQMIAGDGQWRAA
jgi:hypothetical protein